MTKTLVCVCALLGAVVACNFGFANGPDRPDENGTLGTPPPADFHCERGDRQPQDRNKDNKPDYVVHVVNGETVCHGEDEDYDGDIDHWTMYQNGRPVRHARNAPGGYVFTDHTADGGTPP